MNKGSCLCKKVQFEVSEAFYFQGNCHCTICRKSHGANLATQGMVKGSGFKLISGNNSISEFESSEGYFRAFCSCCGSRVFSYPKSKAFYGVALNSLDDATDIAPTMHVYTDSKAKWHVIGDDLPQFDQLPDNF